MNLKPRFLLLTIILFVIAAIPAWFAVRMLAEGIVEQWAILYAEKQALYDKSRTLQPIMREVALSRQLANSQYIRDWARNPGDKTKTRRAIAEMERKYQLRCCNVFHAGDGNLHPLILFDANKPGDQHTAEAFGAEILELSVALGGTITGEHGVGIEKINQMCSQFATPEILAFHRVKAAFDPAGLLNPGKVIPTLHRCAEYGKMLVRGGKIAFPELERF